MSVCYDFGHDFIRNKQNALDYIPDWVLHHIKSPEGHLHLSACNYEEDLHAPYRTNKVFYNNIIYFNVLFYICQSIRDNITKIFHP